jgi:hypothetical protein
VLPATSSQLRSCKLSNVNSFVDSPREYTVYVLGSSTSALLLDSCDHDDRFLPGGSVFPHDRALYVQVWVSIDLCLSRNTRTNIAMNHVPASRLLFVVRPIATLNPSRKCLLTVTARSRTWLYYCDLADPSIEALHCQSLFSRN